MTHRKCNRWYYYYNKLYIRLLGASIGPCSDYSSYLLKGNLRAENPHGLWRPNSRKSKFSTWFSELALDPLKPLGIRGLLIIGKEKGREGVNPRTSAQSVCSYCLNWARRPDLCFAVWKPPPQSQFGLNQCGYCGLSSCQFGVDSHIGLQLQLSAI